MNWDAISAMSETVAAITVIVTLVYLSVQIRQNTNATRSAATQGVSDEITGIYKLLASDPELAMVFARGLSHPEKLNDEEVVRFMSFMQLMVFAMQNWLVQTQQGSIDPDLWNNWTKLMKGPGRSSGFRFFWEQRAMLTHKHSDSM